MVFVIELDIRIAMHKILITGASSGIGLRLTRDFLINGDAVVASYYTNDRPLKYLAKKYSGLKTVKWSLEQEEQLKYPDDSLDILVLCAGAIRSQLMLKESSDNFSDCLQQNLIANFRIIKKLCPLLLQSSNAHIIVLSSLSSLLGDTGQVSYSTSKASLNGLSKALAQELAGKGIKVNTIFPGFMKSKQTISKYNKLMEKYKRDNVLKKINTLSEISAFIQHLTTTRNISGQVFNLDSRIY